MEEGGPEANPQELRRNSELPSIQQPPRLLRVRLWQAIAGMSVAIAIALLIVISELAGSLAHRAGLSRRVASLSATVRNLRRQKAVTQRKLGSERERATAGQVFEKILFAPDLRTIKLAAPNEKDKEKDRSTAQSDASAPPSGMLAMSESAGVAMLEASGLKPTGAHQVYRIWWMPKRGAPVWAADFVVGGDGAATVAVNLPPGHEKEPSLSVTLENQSHSETPAGPIALRGEASPVQGRRTPRR